MNEPFSVDRPPGRISGWRPSDRGYDIASALWISIVAIIVLGTFRDYGDTFDEATHIQYGDHILAFYTSGFVNRTAVSFERFYGGGFDLLGAVARSVYPMNPYQTQHLLGGLVGLIGLAGAWRLARLLWGPLAGFASVVLLALTPVYYGQIFNNAKDPPFAVGYVWAIYFLVDTVGRFPAVPWSSWIKLGLAMGAAMSVRIGGLLLPCFLFLCVAAYCAHGGSDAWRRLGMLARGAAASTVTAWLVMMALWPQVLFYPFRGPAASLEHMSNFPRNKPLPFGDSTIRPSEVPWDYLPRNFLLCLPEIVLVLAAGSLLVGAWRLAASAASADRLRRNIAHGLIGFAIFFPPAYAIWKGAPLYDGARHFLFIVPLIAAAAGGAFSGIVEYPRRRRPWWAIAFVIATALLCANQVRIMIELHPFEYVFFNRLAGGLGGAHERYETDYLGATYRETALGLQEYLWRSDRAAYLDHEYTVTGCFSGAMARENLPPNFHYYSRDDSPRKRDFWLGYTGRSCHKRFDDRPVIVTVERQGVPLAVVRDLRAERAKRPDAE